MDTTKMPTLEYFQWARPDAPNPKLAAPIDADDTTLVFSSAPEDEDGNVITGAFLMGIKNSESYVETVYVPAGALSVDGLTATGVVRGIDISGIDYTTGNSNFASSFDQDSPVFCNVTAVAASIMRDLLQGTNQMATGGTSFTIGTEPGASGETVTLYRTTTAGVRKGFFRWESGTGKTQYSDDGTTWVDNDDNTAGNLSLVSANDTTAGYLNGKLVAGANITLTENNDGGNETLTIAASSANETVTTHATYTPAYLTGGNAPETNVAIWDSVSDGEFAITIDGVAREITGLDFTTPVTSMADVAAVIQAGIRAVTGSTETCTWSGTEFVISSVDTTASSAITKTSTVAAPAGTDISGAGASAYMDCAAGSTAAVTDKVLDPTADVGKVPALNANGNVDTDLLQEVIPTGGYTAKGEIVAGTAADTPGLLSVGSDGQVLTADSGETTGLKWGDTNDQFVGLGGATATKTYMQIPLVNLDAVGNVWNVSSAGTLTRTLVPGGIHLNATGTNGYSYLFTQNGAFVDMTEANNVLRWDSTFTTIVFECYAQFNANVLTDGNSGLGFSGGSTKGLTHGSASTHIGFNIDTSGNLYASNGNGASGTNASVQALSANTWYRLRCEWEAGVDAKFYVNGSLVSTSTTNLPSSSEDIQFIFGVYETGGTSEMGFVSGVLGIEI